MRIRRQPFTGDQYVPKAVENAEQASELVELGFDYVCTTPEEVMIFRKTK